MLYASREKRRKKEGKKMGGKLDRWLRAVIQTQRAKKKNINGKIIPPNRKSVRSNGAIKEGLVQVGAGNSKKNLFT